jgi:phage shock protein A
VASLKDKELLVDVLEKQVQGKNECIDYLTGQLEVVETNSSQLLAIISSLERRLEQMEARAHTARWPPREVLQTFSDSKY